ncbi:excinuclease ABC subunit UvrC [Francisellaceae bacterium]|nr:excinuclease ABC subunit UvrC [Francisellaceae bacterium]
MTTYTEDNFNLDDFLKNLTAHPGVYRMFDVNQNILYIGKAKNLKKRVSSYFQKTAKDTKTMQLVSRIVKVEITITNSDYEAFLLESNLIKKHRPRYNILFKDDKSYPYLVLSGHDFPRVYGFRGKANKREKYFGPYVSLSSIKDTLSLLQKTFLVRQCQDAYYRSRTRPCLQYQIKRCMAPCVGYISQEDYQEQVDLLEQFLNGRLHQVLERVSLKMEESSISQNYELAGIYRDQLVLLRKLQEQQSMDTNDAGLMDVFGIASIGYEYVVVMLQVLNGKVVGDQQWFVKLDEVAGEQKVLTSLLGHYYLSNDMRTVWPSQVVLPLAMNIETDLLTSISKRAGKNMAWLYQPREAKKKLQKLALLNAESRLAAKCSERLTHAERIDDLVSILSLSISPKRFECFDISHFQGEAAVASCVVMDEKGIDKSSYRKFKITNITPGDDYAAIKQAVARRLTRAVKEENLPEVLVIDGGKGQFKQAHDVLVEMELVDEIVLLSLGKGPERVSGDEDIYYGLGQSPLRLPEQQPAFLLLRQIRDEAHRFAMTGQRGAVSKQRKKSVLDDIAGIGPKKKKAILMHFGGWQELEKASMDEIQKVEGVSQKLAELIWHSLK